MTTSDPDIEPELEDTSVREEIQVVLDTLRGADYFGKLANGHDLADLLQTVYENIVSPDNHIHGFNRTAEFVSRYMAFGKTNSEIGIVKTPEHIANLMCDLAEINHNSRVLDITCGTGTFLTAALDKMMQTATPTEQQNLPERIFGMDSDSIMAGIARNNLNINGVPLSNIHAKDCFDEIVNPIVARFKPNVVIFNPPHQKKGLQQPYDPLEFLERACDLCARDGTVIALMPISSLIVKSQGKDRLIQQRTSLLEKHRLVATMELPQHIFHLLPKSADTPSPSTAIVIMQAHRSHNHEDHDVWMAIWPVDGKTHKSGYGLVDDEGMLSKGLTWDSIRYQWVSQFANRISISLTSTPSPSSPPLLGASHQRKIKHPSKIDDWIASAEIPSPDIHLDKTYVHRMQLYWGQYLSFKLLMGEQRSDLIIPAKLRFPIRERNMQPFRKQLQKMKFKDFNLTDLGKLSHGKEIEEKYWVPPSNDREGHPFVKTLITHNKNAVLKNSKMEQYNGRIQVENFGGIDGKNEPNGPKGTIAIDFKGGTPGHAAYYDEPYYCYSDLLILNPKDELNHPLVSLFLSWNISNNNWRWGRNRKLNRLKYSMYKVSLPITEENEIDVTGIKKLMNRLPYSWKSRKRLFFICSGIVLSVLVIASTITRFYLV